MPEKEEVHTMKEELACLENELKHVQSAATTKQRCQELLKYIKENEPNDQLVKQTPANPFTQPQGGKAGCCG